MTSTDENRTQTPAADTARPAREPRSYAGWLATLFVLALVAWMGSGYLYPAEDTATAPQARQQQPFTVEAFASNATEEGRRKNRRIEIHIIHRGAVDENLDEVADVFKKSGLKGERDGGGEIVKPRGRRR